MKLALIGGGGVRSAFFTRSVSKYAKLLGITEISIMDNNPMKLEIYGNLGRYTAGLEDSVLAVTLTGDFKEAVNGADYVVTTIRVGEEAGRILDEHIPLKYNIIGQETTGPGGFSYALRTIPVMREYCETIKQISNNALVFNFTNPSGLVTQAMHSYGYHNVIGICDGPTHLETEIAQTLGINVDDVSAGLYGLNHLSWMNSYKVKGREIMPALLANDDFLNNSAEFGHFDNEVIRYVKGIPSAYLYYFYYREEAVRNVHNSKQTRGEIIKDINDTMNALFKEMDVTKNPETAFERYRQFFIEREKSYMATELKERKQETRELSLSELGLDDLELTPGEGVAFEGYSGVAFNYIMANRNDTGKLIPMSVPNNGAIKDMADEDVLEITCRVDKEGAHPVTPEYIPETNLRLMQQVKLYERLTVEAVDKKSKEVACFALMNHPLVGSYTLAKCLVDDYTSAFSEYFSDWK